MAWVEKRGKKWSVCYRTDDERGQSVRHRVGGFDTKEAAWEAARTLERSSNAGINVHGDKMTCGELMESWFASKSAEIAATTKAKYSAAIDTLSESFIYEMPIRKLKKDMYPMLIEDLCVGRDGRTLSTVTAFYRTEPLRLALSWATQEGLIPINPLKGVKNPEKNVREQRILNDDDVHALVEESQSHPFRIPLLLALFCGLRREESAGLRWKDVDFARSTITVNQAITLTSDGQEVLKETKTKQSRRTIPIPRFLRDELQMMQKRSDRVCAAPNGKPYKLGSYAQAVRRLIHAINDKRAGSATPPMPQATYHDLRHTHAAMLIKLKFQPKVIAERLGHTSIKMTMDTYGYLMPGLQEEVADALDLQFQSSSSGGKSGGKG